ncbi:MAG: alpha/beta hydrolase [Marinifilum sp.]|jgi:pimeloyl-ACP methyl ester carboxylesterase|nr:alpha/beta hydrolase [Marinifilum sp.]
MQKILFIHGNSLSPDSFSNQCNGQLADSVISHTINLNELLNGETSLNGSNLFSFLSSKILELHTNNQYDYMVGHSFGGHAIVQSLPQLQGLKGILTFGAPPLGISLQMDKAFFSHPHIGLAHQAKLTNDEINSLAKAYLHKQEFHEQVVDMISNSNPLLRELIPQVIALGGFKDETEILRTTTIPLAILHGEQDKLINPKYYLDLELSMLYGGEVQIIPDAGHCPQLENADCFSQILLSYINY